MVNLKTIIIIYLYEFKLYMVSELQFTHFLSHDFLKYVMVSHIYIDTHSLDSSQVLYACNNSLFYLFVFLD